MWDLKSQRAFSCASYTGPFPRSTLFLTLVISEFFFSAQSQEISVCLGWKWALWVFSHILQNPGVLNFPHVYGGPLWSWVSCSPPAPSWSQTSDLCQYRIFSLTGVPCLSHRHRWLSLQSSPLLAILHLLSSWKLVFFRDPHRPLGWFLTHDFPG